MKDAAPSLWLDQACKSSVPRPRLNGDVSYDVVIVGAGFTGMWTAYYLARIQPDCRVAVVERAMAGFGAAGRNAGWVSGGIPGRWSALSRRNGLDAARRAMRETYLAIDRIGEVINREAIDCGFEKGGALTIATTPAQAARLQDELRGLWHRGLDESYLHQLDEDEDLPVQIGVRVERAAFTPFCARVDPGRLARGLAEACERTHTRIYECTEAVELLPSAVRCRTGVVRADHVVQATEAYSLRFHGQGRRFMPLYSVLAATEPLSPAVWKDLDWQHGLGVKDCRHLHFYAQRTADDRLAMGRRGEPYRLGAPLSDEVDRHFAVKERIAATMRRYFPAAAEAPIAHFWGGPLALPREERMSVWYDRANGQGWAGGYGGHGIVAANIAGRTLADLILDRKTDLTALPWVGKWSSEWNREPLRYLASRATARNLERADDRDDRESYQRMA